MLTAARMHVASNAKETANNMQFEVRPRSLLTHPSAEQTPTRLPIAPLNHPTQAQTFTTATSARDIDPTQNHDQCSSQEVRPCHALPASAIAMLYC
jgi:hypothetical protein